MYTRYLLGALLACLPYAISAQVSIPKAMTNGQIDSLHESIFKKQPTNIDEYFTTAAHIKEVSTRNRYKDGIWKADVVRGLGLYTMGKFDSARTVLLKCEKHFSETAVRSSLDHGRVLLFLGMTCREMGQLREAKIHANKCYLFFSEIVHERRYVVESLLLLGDIELSLDRFEEALNYFLDAFKLSREGDIPVESVATNLKSIAAVYNRMSQTDQAKKFASLAIHLIDSAGGSTDTKLGVMIVMSNIWSGSGNYDSAILWYEQVRQLAVRAGNVERESTAEYNIANAYANKRQFALSNRLLRAWSRKNPEVYPNMRAAVNRLFAKNYLNLGQYDSSILYGRASFKDAVQNQARINVTDVLWKAFRARGLNDSAFHYLKLHYAYKDSVYNREHQRKFSSVFAEMENIEKQYTIDRLERDKEVAALKKRNMEMVGAIGAFAGIMVICSLVLLLQYRKKKQQMVTAELSYRLEQKQKDLHQQALRMIHINNLLSELEESLREINSKNTGDYQGVLQLIGSMRMSKALEKEWDHFNAYFSSVHEGFIEKIESKFPALSILEKRLIVLVRMNLTNKEIAGILNIESNSVRTSKYRLKKKLGLSDDQDMYAYLHSLETAVADPAEMA